MHIKPLPLAERFDRAYHNEAAHPEYNACLVRSLAHLTMDKYFYAADGAARRLAELLEVSETALHGATYLQIMLAIHAIWAERRRAAAEALGLMAVPFVLYADYIDKERSDRDGKDTA